MFNCIRTKKKLTKKLAQGNKLFRTGFDHHVKERHADIRLPQRVTISALKRVNLPFPSMDL